MAADLRLYDERLDRYVDALYAVLVASGEMQFFPEMREIFGKDSVVKFLDVFAGQTIVVPPREVLEAKIRDVAMWITLCKNGSASVITDLAKEYGLSESQVREKTGAIADCLRKVGVEPK